jgi:hypothetical protein
MDSLQASDALAASVAVAPRVSLADIEGAIAEQHHFIAADAVGQGTQIGPKGHPINPLGLLSICILVLSNGFTVIGKSAPASPQNFDRELGKKFAYDDAIRQLWPLMGFALRDRLATDPGAAGPAPEALRTDADRPH